MGIIEAIHQSQVTQTVHPQKERLMKCFHLPLHNNIQQWEHCCFLVIHTSFSAATLRDGSGGMTRALSTSSSFIGGVEIFFAASNNLPFNCLLKQILSPLALSRLYWPTTSSTSDLVQSAPNVTCVNQSDLEYITESLQSPIPLNRNASESGMKW